MRNWMKPYFENFPSNDPWLDGFLLFVIIIIATVIGIFISKVKFKDYPKKVVILSFIGAISWFFIFITLLIK